MDNRKSCEKGSLEILFLLLSHLGFYGFFIYLYDMEKEFVPYELAVKLKELGFDEDCFGYYHLNEGYTKGYAFCYFNEPKRYESDSAVLTPTFSQAFRWFREKHDLCSHVRMFDGKFTFEINEVEFVLQSKETHEEAELGCLIKLIEIVEQTKD